MNMNILIEYKIEKKTDVPLRGQMQRYLVIRCNYLRGIEHIFHDIIRDTMYNALFSSAAICFNVLIIACTCNGIGNIYLWSHLSMLIYIFFT